ncbi:hypothetical protein CerSpe_217730 [Prunus speciosa]
MDSVDESNNGGSGGQMNSNLNPNFSNSCYGYPMGLGFCGKFEFGFGLRRGGVRPLRHVDDGNWWSFPTVDVLEISPIFNKSQSSSTPASASVASARKKKKMKVEKLSVLEAKAATELPPKEAKPIPKAEEPGLMLKLDYEDVLNAWLVLLGDSEQALSFHSVWIHGFGWPMAFVVLVCWENKKFRNPKWKLKSKSSSFTV